MVKVECEIEVKSPADKFWEGLKDSASIFPKIFSKRIKNIEIIEGDGISPGTVRLLTYVEGTPLLTFAKEKIEFVHDEDKSLVYSVIDGELTTLFKTLKVSLQVVPKGDESLVIWTMEFEKASEEAVVDPHHLKENATKAFVGLDAYLLEACA